MSNIDQNTEYGGGDIINRFAISGLSKKYNEQALPEEIMVEKTTGEFLIKTPDGVTISYDAMARRRSTIIDATESATTQNMIGNMYELILDNYNLPAIVPYDINLLPNAISLKQNLLKILFFIDIDEVVKANIAEIAETSPIVEIGLRCGTGSIYEDVIVEKPIQEFNNSIINIHDIVERAPDQYNVIITSLKFKKSESNKDDTFIILHNMMVSLF